MRRPTLLACALGLASLIAATPSRAADPAPPAFTPAQKQEIIQIIRDAMKADPSILRDAVVSLQADDQAHEAADAKARLAAHESVLTQNAGDPVAGNPNGNVTLVEFYDPRCPYCRRMLPAVADMLQKDRQLRLVYKDIPVLGPASVLETRAILAAQNQGGYEKMQRALMSNPAQPDQQMIRQTASSLGLNADKLVADMNSQPVTQRLRANLALMKDLKLQGTPAFVVGDQLIPGMVDADQLEVAVAGARKHA